jgi:hypothetical protein
VLPPNFSRLRREAIGLRLGKPIGPFHLTTGRFLFERHPLFFRAHVRIGHGTPWLREIAPGHPGIL